MKFALRDKSYHHGISESTKVVEMSNRDAFTNHIIVTRSRSYVLYSTSSKSKHTFPRQILFLNFESGYILKDANNYCFWSITRRENVLNLGIFI